MLCSHGLSVPAGLSTSVSSEGWCDRVAFLVLCVCWFFLSSVILAVKIVAPRKDAQPILWRGRQGAPRWPQKAIWYRSQGAVVTSRENTSTTLSTTPGIEKKKTRTWEIREKMRKRKKREVAQQGIYLNACSGGGMDCSVSSGGGGTLRWYELQRATRQKRSHTDTGGTLRAPHEFRVTGARSTRRASR